MSSKKQPTYVGVTLGPIYDTIKKARQTREIWGGSYIFSYLCKNIYRALTQMSSITILSPQPPLKNLNNSGVGLYPDRLLLKIDNKKTGDEIDEILKNTKAALADEIWEELKTLKYYQGKHQKHIYYLLRNEEHVKTFLFQYFKVYKVEIAPNGFNLKGKNGKSSGTVITINKYLDYAELMPSLAHLDPDPFYTLLHFINKSFLIKDAFGAKNKKGFPSLAEIATTELRYYAKEEYDKLVSDQLRQLIEDNWEGDDEDTLSKIFKIEAIANSEKIRSYHKYIAIVHADGDRIGKLIGSLDDDEFVNFSRDLMLFSEESNEMLAGVRFSHGDDSSWGYGAAPVYIGGDDMVFFAPVMSEVDGVKKSIFDLIGEIDNKFDDIFNNKDTNGNFKKYPSLSEGDRPKMSYGVCISYHKYPLREAFEYSRDLLNEVKSEKFKSRNRLNVALRKHSGQIYKGVFDKNDKLTLNKVNTLLMKYHQEVSAGDSERFINSVSKNLIRNNGIFKDGAIKSLKQYRKNQFNEPVHKDASGTLDDFFALMEHILNSPVTTDREAALESMIFLLHFLHFTRTKDFR